MSRFRPREYDDVEIDRSDDEDVIPAGRLNVATDVETRHRLTHSRMADAKTCLRKHWYSYELGLERDVEAQPLRMGTAVHLGLDLLAQGQTLDQAVDAIRKNYAELPAWCTTDETCNAWAVESETCVRLVCGYQWRWQDDSIRVISTEQKFHLPLVNPLTNRPSRYWSLSGKIDKVIELPDTRLAVMEHKTTSKSIKPDSDYWRRLRLDQQISLYVIAARELGHDVQTVLYDVIHKPDISPRNPVSKLTKDERTALDRGEYFGEQFTLHEVGMAMGQNKESPAMFGARLSSDIASRPEVYYARQEIPRLESDLDEFRHELWQQQLQIRECQRTDRWYRNTAACLDPYKCAFFDLCTSGVDPRRELPPGYRFKRYIHPELEA